MIAAAWGHTTPLEDDPARRDLSAGADALDLAVGHPHTVELTATVEPGSPEERVVDAMFVCIGRWGLAKTTVEDVARSAGVSRATVYRLFPGGKNAIIQAGLATEVTRLVEALTERLASEDDLESCLGRAISVATTFLRRHEALAFVREHEWTAIESFLAHDRLDALFLIAGSAFGPALGRFLQPEEAERVAVWAARMVVSYMLTPSDGVDLGDEVTARRVVASYLLPGLDAAVRTGTAAAPRPDHTARTTQSEPVQEHPAP